MYESMRELTDGMDPQGGREDALPDQEPYDAVADVRALRDADNEHLDRLVEGI